MSVFSSGPVKSTIITIFHYVTGSCRIALLMGAGDFLMQHYNGAKEIKHINWKRTAKFATIGFCFMGPILTYWKSLVSTIVNASHSHTMRTLKQLFCDHIYLAPGINLGIITMSSVLENESVLELEKRISEYFPYIIKRHYMLWPGVQFFGSLCIQPTLQIGFANLFAILWYAYLSGILHKDEMLQKPNNELEKLIVK